VSSIGPNRSALPASPVHGDSIIDEFTGRIALDVTPDTTAFPKAALRAKKMRGVNFAGDRVAEGFKGHAPDGRERVVGNDDGRQHHEDRSHRDSHTPEATGARMKNSPAEATAS
jgi:hypothetical protein